MRLLIFFLTLPLLATDVSIGGDPYTLRSHPRVYLDGPSGTLSTALQTSPRNTSSNPSWQSIKNGVDAFIADSTSYPNIYGALNDVLRGTGNLTTAWRFGQCANAALLWWAAGGTSQSPIDPNGYLAMAKYCITHVEDYLGTFGCDSSQTYCGRSISSDGDYANNSIHNVAITYTIVRALGIDTTDGLTSAEVTAFANKILNDRDIAHNGIDSSDCVTDGRGVATLTNNGAVTATVSQNGTTVTFSSARTFPANTVLLPYPQTVYQSFVCIIGAITASTTATCNVPAQFAWSGQFLSAPPFSGNPCGIIYTLKNSKFAPPVGDDPSMYGTDYPSPLAGTLIGTGNGTFYFMEGILSIGLALADDDARARTLITQYTAYYNTEEYGWALSAWNGLNTSAQGYFMGRQTFIVPSIALMMKNSLTTGSPPFQTQNLIRNQAKTFYYWRLPWTEYQPPPWGSSASYFQGYDQFAAAYGATFTYQWLLANGYTSEAAQVSYYLGTNRSDFDSFSSPGSYATFPFLLWDPASTQTAPTALPSQYNFTAVDAAYCEAVPDATCYPDFSFNYTVSKSGWDVDATTLWTHGHREITLDHTEELVSGNYGIGRKVLLLAGDNAQGISGAPYHSVKNDNLLAIGGDTTYGFLQTSGTGIPTDFVNQTITPVAVTRWAGTAGTGDASSRYAYLAYDVSGAYTSSAHISRANREIAHFKSGTQDYIVSHDDVATSQGVSIRAYWNYFNNGVACGTAITTWDTTNRIAANTQAASKLVTQHIPITANSLALLRDASDFSYTGGDGKVCHTYTAASSDGSTENTSATSFEEITVQLPLAAASGSMPTVTQLTSTNFAVAQIADSNMPKVAAFAQGGTTYTSASFTSTHAGTAQYLVAGLTAGTYDFKVDGSTVCNDVAVSASDNSLYCEATAGAVTVEAISAPGAEGSKISGSVKFSGGVVIH